MAGFGTGFLPTTKAQPKEMLPIYDKPRIHYLVEEAILSGIDEILIVTGKDPSRIILTNPMNLNIPFKEQAKTVTLKRLEKSPI